MKHRGAVEEFVGDEFLASVRLDNAHAGYLLGQLAGKLAHHVLNVAADRTNARRECAYQCEVKGKSANRNEREPLIEEKKYRHDGQKRERVGPDVDQRAADQVLREVDITYKA